MFVYPNARMGRVSVIYLGRGELILEGIQKAIDRLGIKNGYVLSGIGSACKVVYHRIADVGDRPNDEFFTVEAPIEISAIQGMILEGKPHLHITFCDLERAYGGHLEPGCEVQYLAEIAIAELDDVEIVRRKNEYGVSYMDNP